MMIHSMAPPTGVWNVSAIDGRLMLTIEVSSMIMNVPTATRANVIHGLAGPGRVLASIAGTESGRAGACRARGHPTDVKRVFIKLTLLVPSRFPRGLRRGPDKRCRR